MSLLKRMEEKLAKVLEANMPLSAEVHAVLKDMHGALLNLEARVAQLEGHSGVAIPPLQPPSEKLEDTSAGDHPDAVVGGQTAGNDEAAGTDQAEGDAPKEEA